MSSSQPSRPEPTSSPAPASNRRWGLILLWVLPGLMVLLVFAYGFLTRQPVDDTVPRVGQPLADFTLPDLHGQSVQLAALRGKAVFVNVWATWWPPCGEEMATTQQVDERVRGRGLEVLAVSLDARVRQVVGPFMQHFRLT